MGKIIYKSLCLILSIALLLATIPMISFISFAQTTSVSTLAELNTALANDDIDEIVVTQTITLTDGTVIYGNNKTVTANDTGLNDQGIVQEGSNYNIFVTEAGSTSKIYDLTIMGGSVTAVVNRAATLYLENVSITRSGSASQNGGGLINGTQSLSYDSEAGEDVNFGQDSAKVILVNSSIVRNVAEYGGGFINYGTMIIDGCSLTENRSLGFSGGGGAGENQGIAYVNNSTVANNTSSEIGGGINNCKGGELYLMNSTFTGNVTTNGTASYGGAIGNNYKLVKAVNCIFAYNYYIASDGTPTMCDLGVFNSTSLDLNHCITVDVEGNATWTDICGDTCSTAATDLFAEIIEGSVLMGDGTESTEPYARPAVILNDSGELYAPLSGDYVWDITGVPTYFDYSDLDNIRMYYTDDEGNVSDDSIYAGNYDSNDPDSIKEEYDIPVSGSLDEEDRTTDLIGSSNTLPGDKVIYTVKVIASENGTVSGGTVYGDSYVAFAPNVIVSLDKIVTVQLEAIPDDGYYFDHWEIVEASGLDNSEFNTIAQELSALVAEYEAITTTIETLESNIQNVNSYISYANSSGGGGGNSSNGKRTLVTNTNTLVNQLNNNIASDYASYTDVASAISNANLSTKTYSRNTNYTTWCNSVLTVAGNVKTMLTSYQTQIQSDKEAKEAEYAAAEADAYSEIGINTEDNPLEFVVNRNISLKAIFTSTPQDYIVTFHSNTENDITTTQIFEAGNYSQNLNPNTFTNDDQPFLGWALVYCGDVVYSDEESFTASGDVNLYARWGYTVEYDLNNGRNGPSSQIKIPGETLQLSSIEPSRDGYVFKGWGLNADATSAILQAGDEYGIDSNIVLYAIWEELKAPTVLNANLDDGYVNVPYSDTIETDQEAIFVLVDGNNLPDGLTLSKNGVLSGTPTQTGTYTFTINVYNKADTSYNDASTITLIVTISDAKSALQDLVDEANEIDQDLYTDETSQNLQDAIDEAQDVLDNPDATQEEINQAIEDLIDAIEQLSIDKSALLNAINSGKVITEDENASDNYSAESLADLEDAIFAGEIVYLNSNATAEQIAQATQDILDAISNLERISEPVDKTELQDTVDAAETVDTTDLDSELADALSDAIDNGNDVLDDPDATVSDVQDAIDQIIDALKDILEDKVNDAEEIDTSSYSDDTIADLQDAIDAANDILNDPDVTADDIADAIKAIEDAIENLSDTITITVKDDEDNIIQEIEVPVSTTMEDIAELLDLVPTTDNDDEILVGYVDENGDYITDDTVITNDTVISPYYELTLIVPKDNTDYIIDRTGEDGIINGFNINANTVDEIKADLENDELCIDIVNINGDELNTTDKVGTGSVITYRSKLTGNIYERLVVVIYGDVDGDGIVGNLDYLKLKAITYSTDVVSENIYLKMASDVNGDTAFDGFDCTYIACSMNGINCIQQAREINIADYQ